MCVEFNEINIIRNWLFLRPKPRRYSSARSFHGRRLHYRTLRNARNRSYGV